MPGVLILEAMAQLAGVLLLRRLENTGKLAVLWSIDQVKLRRAVVPGDQLRIEIEATKVRSKMGQGAAVAKVGNHKVGRGAAHLHAGGRVVSTTRVHPLALVEPRRGARRRGRGRPVLPRRTPARASATGRSSSRTSSSARTRRIGSDNQVHTGAVLGGPPQDKTFKGEPTTLTMGNGNVVREYVTVNRGTVKGGGKTIVGDRNLLMACSHIGHDCRIGNDIILANAVLIAGHVQIGDRCVLAGAVACHHFARIGRMAYIGGMSRVVHDVPALHEGGGRARARARARTSSDCSAPA